MSKKSKQKGSGYELKIAKTLTSWWQQEFPEEEFNRVPQSGGLRWKDQEKVSGDIVPPESFPFNIECKKREEWKFEHLFKNRGNIWEWWQQSVDDANRVNKFPLLIFSKNYMLDYIMLQNSIFDLIFPNNYCSYIYIYDKDLVVTCFEYMLQLNPKQMFDKCI